MIKGYFKPKEHYTVCFITIFKGIPCNMAGFHCLPAENRHQMLDFFLRASISPKLLACVATWCCMHFERQKVERSSTSWRSKRTQNKEQLPLTTHAQIWCYARVHEKARMEIGLKPLSLSCLAWIVDSLLPFLAQPPSVFDGFAIGEDGALVLNIRQFFEGGFKCNAGL